MVTFTVEDSDIGMCDNMTVDLEDAIPGYGNPDGSGVITFVAEPGLDNIDDFSIKSVGDGTNDPDVIRFDLTTFSDNLTIIVSPTDGAAADDCIAFIGATSIVDNDGGDWTVTYINGAVPTRLWLKPMAPS